MCYSANASFAASAVLSAVGVVTIKKYHTKKYIIMALLPLICAIQQAAEGILWLNIAMDNFAAQLSKHVFLFFALFLWPYFLSAAFIPLEENKNRKTVLYALLFLGIVIAMYLLFWFVKIGGVPARACDNHIAYSFSYPLVGVTKYLYLICVTAPCFVTSVKRAWILGILLLAGFIYTSFFLDEKYLISIWCFIATASTVTTYYILSTQRNISQPPARG